MRSYPHNRQYVLPFPALEISLRASDDSPAIGALSALVDTGADITLVPLSLLEQIEAPELDEVRLRSHWGHATTVTTYLVNIELSTGVLPGLEVVGDLHAGEIVLGRDVLNRLLLLIDGPRQLTDILLRRPRAN